MLSNNISVEKSYELFGLNSAASIDRIKAVYRQMAKKTHPDLNPDEPTARDRFNTLNQAYQLLLATHSQIERPLDAPVDPAPANNSDVRVDRVVDPPLSPKDLEVNYYPPLTLSG